MKYVVAVSGGIDSVVLLDVLKDSAHELVVAHYDHGIRQDSHEDATFVRSLAAQYGLPYYESVDSLGETASEEQARNARHAWLQMLRRKTHADAIATAHHEDDVIETMMLNVLRGTGWRGLASLREHPGYARPLLGWSKADVISYAIEHSLLWHDDSTNDNVRYARNYIRYRYAQRLTTEQRSQWLKLYKAQKQLLESIDNEIQAELKNYDQDKGLSRYRLIMSGRHVAGQIITALYGRMEATTVAQLWHFICTARPGKRFRQGDYTYVVTTRDLFVSRSDT